MNIRRRQWNIRALMSGKLIANGTRRLPSLVLRSFINFEKQLGCVRITIRPSQTSREPTGDSTSVPTSEPPSREINEEEPRVVAEVWKTVPHKPTVGVSKLKTLIWQVVVTVAVTHCQ